MKYNLFLIFVFMFLVLFLFIIGLGEKTIQLEKRINNQVCPTCHQILN